MPHRQPSLLPSTEMPQVKMSRACSHCTVYPAIPRCPGGVWAARHGPGLPLCPCQPLPTVTQGQQWGFGAAPATCSTSPPGSRPRLSLLNSLKSCTEASGPEDGTLWRPPWRRFVFTRRLARGRSEGTQRVLADSAERLRSRTEPSRGEET